MTMILVAMMMAQIMTLGMTIHQVAPMTIQTITIQTITIQTITILLMIHQMTVHPTALMTIQTTTAIQFAKCIKCRMVTSSHEDKSAGK